MRRSSFWKKCSMLVPLSQDMRMILILSWGVFMILLCWDTIEIATWNGIGEWNITQWINSPLFYLYIFSQLIVGLLLDITRPSRLCMIGFGLCSLGSLSLFFSWMTLGKFFLSLGSSIPLLSSLLILDQSMNKKHVAFSFGCIGAVGMIVAIFHQIFFILHWSIPMIWLIGGVFICSLYSVYLFSQIPKPLTTPSNTVWNRIIPSMLAQKRQVLLHALVAAFLLAPSFSFIGFWLKPFLLFSSYSTTTAYLAALCFYIGFAIGLPIIGWISDRFGTRRPLMLTAPIFAFTAMIPVIYVPNIWPFVLCALLFGIGLFSSVVILSFIFTLDKKERHKGLLLGIVFFIQLLGTILLHWISTSTFALLHSRLSDYADLKIFNIVLMIFPLSYVAAFTITLFLQEDTPGHIMRIWRIKLR